MERGQLTVLDAESSMFSAVGSGAQPAAVIESGGWS
jgi:hypothetical protein